MTCRPLFLLVIGLLWSAACSDDSQFPSLQPDEMADVEMSGDSSQVSDTADASWADAAPDVDTLPDAGDEEDMPHVDGGPEEPCPNGICTPQDCIDNGWVPPSNLQRDTQLILRDESTTLTWEQFFGQPFPRGNARILEVEPDQYAAIEFSTADYQKQGTVIFDNPQAAGPWGSRLITINQCPGYFGPSPYPSDADCREWKFAIGNIDYKIGASEDTRGICDLEADRTYYLNIVFVDEVLPEGSEDLTWRCSIGGTEDETWDTCGALMEQTYIID